MIPNMIPQGYQLWALMKLKKTPLHPSDTHPVLVIGWHVHQEALVPVILDGGRPTIVTNPDDISCFGPSIAELSDQFQRTHDMKTRADAAQRATAYLATRKEQGR